MFTSKLVATENVSCIYFVINIIQTSIVSVSNDGMTLDFKLLQVIYYLAAKECSTIFKCWLVDDDFCALCFDALHDALNGRLTEVVTI